MGKSLPEPRLVLGDNFHLTIHRDWVGNFLTGAGTVTGQEWGGDKPRNGDETSPLLALMTFHVFIHFAFYSK